MALRPAAETKSAAMTIWRSLTGGNCGPSSWPASVHVERLALAGGQLAHARLCRKLGQAPGVFADVARVPDPEDVARVLYRKVAAVGREHDLLNRAVENVVADQLQRPRVVLVERPVEAP